MISQVSDDIDQRLSRTFPGCVVRKDLLHRIKKGTNVPSFVLEFLLAKFCATEDPAEIDAGIEAVFETINRNYVRPDEANRAQSRVQQEGRHKFIDKIHVSYVEREKRHWAAMENFNSRRIAISERFYANNDRLLEGGIWAEVTLGYNDIEDDDYAFFVEDMRPIQLSRFDFDSFCVGRNAFTRDEWLDIILRSIGLEPARMEQRLKFHFLVRLFPFVEANYNFIELGPRGTGKSYVFSEFSPYATLISGGQTSTSVLFYNNQRRRVGIIGFWDVVAFDEVGGIRVKDPDTIQIMKDYMANGRFSRGPAEIIANASLAFVGNIDDSIEALVRSPKKDLFQPLPPSFDLALLHRFHTYLPGWEIPASSSDLLTVRHGFITDYLAEALRHLAKSTNRFSYVKSKAKLGPAVRGRDETAVIKTVAAFLKLLHPSGEPTEQEFNEYLEYALEGRRRVKEQLNKRKPDDEFAAVEFSYFPADRGEKVITCLESKLKASDESETPTPKAKQTELPTLSTASPGGAKAEPNEKHFTIRYGDTGYSYASLFSDYLAGAKMIKIADPYIRTPHQLANFTRFCELAVKIGSAERITLKTAADDHSQEVENSEKLDALVGDLKEYGISLEYDFDSHIHDRQIELDNGWVIKIGRGLDIYQRLERPRSGLGMNDWDLRPCLETNVDIFMKK
ncbi:BREX system Lon protease-like protein BrxL [Opitutaceae bacterium TAV4]|nr:BREX system Lon protease-like protein BrxL [Opitutaceae bacterium TAV4]RRK01998.1 BREX system Lon protease-like protein BrxL [Opitutaceae bacterium TAV3]